MNDIELEEFKDNAGVSRKLGLWLPTPSLSKAPLYAVPEMSDTEIRKIIQAPGRVPRRTFFDDYWMKKGDQKQHGSCNGWAGAMGLSKARWLRGIRDKLVLSGSYVYSWINGNQDNGSDLKDGMNELMAHGAPSVESCGPNLIYRNQTAKFDAEALLHLGIDLYRAGTLQAFKTGIALGSIGIVAVQAGASWLPSAKVDKNGVIKVDRGQGNHAIHVDDLKVLSDGTILYDAANNWNVTWADQGRVYCSDGTFEAPFETFDFYLIPSTQEAGL